MTDEVQSVETEEDFDAMFDEYAAKKDAGETDAVIEDDEPEEVESSQDSADEPEEDEPEAQESELETPVDEKTEEVDPLVKAQQEIDQWKHKYNSDIGRVNAYQRKTQELEQQLKELQANKNENPQGSGYSDEQWKALVEDYPDIAQAFEKRLEADRNQYNQQLSQLTQQIQPLQQMQQESYRNAQLQQLNQAHPDWQDVVQKPEYMQWLNSQPEEIQAFMGSEDAQRNIYLLNSYKSATQQPVQANEVPLKRQKQLQQAQTVSNRATSNKNSALDTSDYDAMFDHYAKKKDSRK